MSNAETRLEWIIAHRGEPEMEAELCKLSAKLDAEIVEETLCHVWAGFYDAENPIDITIRPIAKQCYAVRRDRKIADNRKHYAKLCAKRGAMINGGHHSETDRTGQCRRADK